MTLRHLELFEAAARCGTMSRAAQELYVSQPAISQAVRELEAYYHVQLFKRLNRTLQLTDEGALLLVRTRHILEELADTRAELESRAAAPVVRLGASATVGTCLMLPLTQAMERAYPGVDLRVTVTSTANVEREILNGTLDAAIVEGEVTATEVCREPLWQDELVLLAGPGHPFFNRETVALRELSGQALIAREQSSAERNQLGQYLSEQGIQMIKKWDCSNVSAIKRVVEAGQGLAVLSRRMAEKELADGSLRAVPLLDADGSPLHVRRAMKLIWHRNKYFSSALTSFFTLCRSMKDHAPDRA